MARSSPYGDVKFQVLAELRKAAEKHAKPPSVRMLAETFSVSPSTMHSYLAKLIEEGMIEWSPGRHRTWRLTQAGIAASSQPVP